MLYNPLNTFLEKTRLLFQRRVKDGQPAVLGDGTGRVEVPDRPGYVYIRYPGTPDANGNATYSSPGMARASGAAFSNYEGASVYVAIGYNNELEVVSANYQSLDQAGIDTRTLNPLHQQSKWVYLWQFTLGLCTAVATTVNNSFLVTIKNHLVYVGNVFQFFETGAQADKIDLSAYVPAVDMQCYAAVWVDTYTNAAEVTTSTAQSLFSTLDDSDINEVVTLRPPDAMPYKIFWLANDQGTVTIQAANDIDLRQFLNTPPLFGFPNPVAYRERIQPDRQQVFTGTLVVTGTLEVLGALIGVAATGGGGSGSGGVTSVTASAPLSSSGGTTPNITHDTSGISAAEFVNPVMTTDLYGHITAIASGAGSWKRPVKLATAEALPAYTYNNGTSGVGATLTANANGALAVDGLAVSTNDRILVKNEGSSGISPYNGIYTVTAAGNAGAPWVLTRATDFDTSDKIRGAAVPVTNGARNISGFGFTIILASVTIGTSNILFIFVPTPQYALVIDQKTSGTNGGSSAATTWNNRDLQTEVTDPAGIVTLSSNKMTLVRGTFLMMAVSPVVAPSGAAMVATSRIFDVTGGTTIRRGPTNRVTLDDGVFLPVWAIVTGDGTTEFRIDSYTSAARATIGLGQAATEGTAEVFTMVYIWRIGD